MNDRYWLGYLFGRMSAGKPAGCGCLVGIAFYILVIWFMWTMLHTPWPKVKHREQRTEYRGAAAGIDEGDYEGSPPEKWQRRFRGYNPAADKRQEEKQ
jgi:hypothetical protein